MTQENYIKLASYLDSLGKFKQADNIDRYIKISQYSQGYTPETYAEGGPQNQYQGGYLSAVKGKLMQSGLNAQLLSSQNSYYGSGTNSIIGFKPLTPNEVAQLLKQPGGKETVQAYMVQLGESLIADAANYTGPQKLQMIIENVYKPALKSVPTAMINEFYLNNMEDVIKSEIRNIIQNGTVQNLENAEIILRSVNIPLIFSKTFPEAIKFTLQNMSLDTSPQVQQKLNTFASSNFVKKYVPDYRV